MARGTLRACRYGGRVRKNAIRDDARSDRLATDESIGAASRRCLRTRRFRSSRLDCERYTQNETLRRRDTSVAFGPAPSLPPAPCPITLRSAVHAKMTELRDGGRLDFSRRGAVRADRYAF